ncbi:MAG TPA: AraC family transcriptional regulator [Pyrinomonadaceae bacterium]|nr:AraC family transcriptional regulator [Pyrinomonadaceae bacterium]
MKSRTLLAVGPWRECGKVVALAIANRWSVLYTLLFEDVPTALARTRIDLILLSGCSLRDGWEDVARGAWDVCRDTPVVALGSNSGQDSLVSALVGQASSGADAERGNNFIDEGPPRFFEDVPSVFRCSEVSPTLRLFEPEAAGVCPSIARAIEFIERSYAEPITLADAARAARYSRCHFSKIFKKQLGVCFVGYLTRVRLRRAAELLGCTEMPVTTIAFAVGFNDLSHFERVFRAVHHKPPTRFRAESKEMPGVEKYLPSFSALAVTS